MSLRRSLLDHFVTAPGDPRPAPHEDFVSPDEGPDRACAEPAPRTPPGVGVLCVAADALPLGTALGLALASARGTPVVAVCVWSPAAVAGPAWRAPAPPATRRLATALAARGHDARPAGRLAIVRLPPAPHEAAAQARRVTAAAGGAPTVLALGGPRTAALDALLSEQDLVLVSAPSGTDPALARLALAGLTPAMARACVCEISVERATRSLAVAGLALLPSARRAFAGALEALP